VAEIEAIINQVTVILDREIIAIDQIAGRTIADGQTIVIIQALKEVIIVERASS
jgi:hypothetical protein